MIAAAHLDNFLFLIFFAVAILFQLLARLASKTGRRPGGDSNRRSTSSSQIPRPASQRPEETEEDRVRKFLEALGQPTSSRPPPPVAPRTDIPPRPVAPIKPPPEMRSFSFPTRQVIERRKSIVISHETTQTPMPTRERKVSQPKSELTAFEVQAGPSPLAPIGEAEVLAAPKPVASQAKIDLAMLLRSTSGLRNAIILREVFGPPRSMQPLDLMGNV